MDAAQPTTRLLTEFWSAHAGAPSCTVLDTGLDQSQSTLTAVLRAWQDTAQRPLLLHYVALLPPGTTDVPLAAVLERLGASAMAALDAGVHRIVVDALRVSLTLCIGEPLALLGELRLQADLVLAGPGCAHWDKWWLKALARCCRRGTALHAVGAAVSAAVVQEAGFLPSTTGAGAVYAPRWDLKTSRQSGASTPLPVGRCAVVGAGLSGAAVAQALALRGWQVDVYDQHHHAAQGASGLPAGLVVPHVSADDSPRSRLSRRGTRLLLAQAQQYLVPDQDFACTGVLEQGSAPIWHAHAGWIKPAQMVRAWLAQPGVAWAGGAQVVALQRAGPAWQLRGCDGQLLGQADAVVLANAHGCAPLVANLAGQLPLVADLPDKLAALQQLHGTVSMGYTPHRTDAAAADALPLDWPAFPVNGQGSFLPRVPGALGLQWHAGATYETDAARAADVAAQHQANACKLLQLLPAVGRSLQSAFGQGTVRHWSNTRCVTHDRMPLVGPVDAGPAPTVWLCVGMGSRGLSFAALCAQLLVARMGAEPWPVEASLARSLQSSRARRRAR